MCVRSHFQQLALDPLSALGRWARSLFYLSNLSRASSSNRNDSAGSTIRKANGESMLNAPLMCLSRGSAYSVLPCVLVGPSATMVTR